MIKTVAMTLRHMAGRQSHLPHIYAAGKVVLDIQIRHGLSPILPPFLSSDFLSEFFPVLA
ncbi:hypothetical protein V8J88_07450 [Massilia sp. W12]|uniref:hypothetical protein n=1 Tax=Massilia sp. W12 TaxID=3126507 RepID=UPI0030CA5F6D